eukprot:366436-Chlamydomonas_euryale.AAC.10
MGLRTGRICWLQHCRADRCHAVFTLCPDAWTCLFRRLKLPDTCEWSGLLRTELSGPTKTLNTFRILRLTSAPHARPFCRTRSALWVVMRQQEDLGHYFGRTVASFSDPKTHVRVMQRRATCPFYVAAAFKNERAMKKSGGRRLPACQTG